MVATVLLVVCNVLSILLMNSQTIKQSRNLIYAYYIVYSWLFFGVLWTIIRIANEIRPRGLLAVMGVLSAVMTCLIIVSFNARGGVDFNKKILFGRIWWVAQAGPEGHGILGFDTFWIVSILAFIMIISYAVKCQINTHKMFRGKYLALILCQLVLMIMAVLGKLFGLPLWIYTLVMNPVCYIAYYLAFVQSDIRLRNEVIMSFANEMSDGLILYNSGNDLIHVNDLIRNILDADFLEKLKDINVLEEWISHVENVENIQALPYSKGEEEYFFTVRKHYIGSDQNPIGRVYVLHDTTNSINQIRLVKKVNTELERTARMKSDFLANMSHELRTPMNAVIGMAEIALREELTPRLRDCLDQINSSGRSLLSIINDILDYSKIDAGRMEIVPEKYEPLSEVNDIANIIMTRIGEKDIELYFIVDPALPHELIGDSMRIRQILINLANNAVKFTEKGIVRITLETEKISDDEVMLTYHIVDTGKGIKEEDLEKLFVSFSQVDSKRNRNVEGTGLGLAISKSLCEAMGGSIGVSSEYGSGSDFWFKIPQKIADGKRDLEVEDADNKYVYCINENHRMTNEFSYEMAMLGVEGRIISGPEEYVQTGKKEFLFFEENAYSGQIRDFLDEHPDITGVVLTGMGSDMRPDKKNLRIMMRPQTTLAMVLILNDKSISDLHFSSENDRRAYFVAPEARVLIVDDNSINLSIATGLLEPMKIICDTALGGEEAIEKIRREKYDIVFMDHMMPGMDGIETTHAIREQIPDASNTPIIALTANVVEGSKDIFLEAGMVDMVAKPIDVKILTRKLYTWLPEYKIQHMDADEIENRTREFEEKAGEFDCLDCEKAIQGLGSATLFAKIVETYYKRGPQTRLEIENAFDSGDIADYAIKTHALKSSSRQIGAMELGDIAEKLEKAGKASDLDTINEYHGRAMDMLGKLIDDLSKYFSEDEASDTDLPLITEAELNGIFLVLAEACENLEMDEMEACARKLKKYSYPDDRKDIMERLYAAIDMVDTEGCIEIMGEYE